MSWFAKGHIKLAVKTLRRNRGRSLLTMLGIIIGVTSVVTVVGIGEGVQHQINAQTEHLGKDLITIRPGQLLTQPNLSQLNNLGLLNGLGSSGSLSDSDVHTVQTTPGVANAVPLSVVSSGVVSSEHSGQYNVLVIGTDKQFPTILNQPLTYGTVFDSDSSSANKVVLGSHAARALFEENVPLGQSLTILGHQFIVIGIFSDFQTAPLSVDVDFNNAVFIPYTTAQQITNNNSPIYEMLARPSDINQTSSVVSRLSSSLRIAHGGEHNFTVLEQSQTIAVTDNILHLLTGLIAGVASISMLVGGIGIMNVVLVSITERMHEIGIRKAVGATNRQILSQFVTEAAVLSVTGGVVGIILSFAVEVSLRLLTNLTPTISWQVVVTGCLTSIALGLVFGTVPALKAARKDPIEALRNE